MSRKNTAESIVPVRAQAPVAPQAQARDASYGTISTMGNKVDTSPRSKAIEVTPEPGEVKFRFPEGYATSDKRLEGQALKGGTAEEVAVLIRGLCEALRAPCTVLTRPVVTVDQDRIWRQNAADALSNGVMKGSKIALKASETPEGTSKYLLAHRTRKYEALVSSYLARVTLANRDNISGALAKVPEVEANLHKLPPRVQERLKGVIYSLRALASTVQAQAEIVQAQA